jgi:hypothetical protein
MKNLCFIHILLFILAMLVYQCTQAQDYVVTTKSDTLYGSVKPITFSTDKKVQVTTADKKKTVFSILQVRSFSLKDEVYTPVRTPKGYVFMKLLKPGYLSLLAFQIENATGYDGMYLLKKDGNGIEVPNLAFKKIVSGFLDDCADVNRKIASGEFTKRNLDKLVDEYNACVKSRTESQDQVIATNKQVAEKINAWDDLEAKVKAKEDFQGKQDALDMITDIKSKINRKEKVPNFIVEGLKSSLTNANLSVELEAALKELGSN